MKACTKCKIEKPLEQFPKRKKNADGYGSICADCHNALNRQSYEKNKVARIAKTKEWAQNNKEKRREIVKKSYRKNPLKKWASNLKRFYNITAEEYYSLLTSQGNCCAICKKTEDQNIVGGQVKRLSVDHCHTTGKIVGILCDACNTSLGKFNHDSELLIVAAKYAVGHKSTK